MLNLLENVKDNAGHAGTDTCVMFCILFCVVLQTMIAIMFYGVVFLLACQTIHAFLRRGEITVHSLVVPMSTFQGQLFAFAISSPVTRTYVSGI